jgi:DNA-binding transcriptional LysR family regulator
MDTHAAMHTFADVVELGSFAAAAEKSMMARSVVSRQISHLEQHYGIRLLNRTTRKLSLTDAGRDFYDRIRPILADVAELESLAGQTSPRANGRIRISAPVSFGIHRLGPAIVEYQRLTPGIEIDLELTDRVVDIIEEGIDMAVRTDARADASLTAKALASEAVHVCAAPGYVAEHGAPTTPNDLKHHACLHQGRASDGGDTWIFGAGRHTQSPKIKVVMRSNNGDILRIAALDGQGIARLPGFLVDDDIRTGRLQQLLPDYSAPALTLSILYPPRRQHTPTVQSLVAFLHARFGTAAPAAATD